MNNISIYLPRERIVYTNCVSRGNRGASPSVWLSGGIAAGGKVGGTISSTKVGSEYIINRSINVGLGLPAGPIPVNVAGGVSNTFKMHDFKK